MTGRHDEEHDKERDEERGEVRDEARDAGTQDPGAYIGREPERATETIPGGVRPDDDRVAGYASQGTGVGRPDVRGQERDEPEGHRSTAAGDDTLREAGQNR